MSERLKIGLVGAGVFAGYHANKLSAHPRVTFTGIADMDAKRATALGRVHGVSAMTLVKLLEVSDAIVIASAASAHGAIAIQALQAGCHCLIEKPLSTSSNYARDIVILTNKRRLTVQVGHQERLVLRAIGLDAVQEKPLKIEAVRNAPYSVRGTDTSVTMDLMSHDIDLCTAIMSGAATAIKGESACVRSKTADMAYAILRYGDMAARLSANRVADKSERWMKLTYPSGIVNIDFNTKTLTNSTVFALNENFGNDEIAKDSLGAATDIFVRAVLDRTPVLVSAEDGAIAVSTAQLIDSGEI